MAISIFEFNQKYPKLALFALEKFYPCGKGYISIYDRCYTNPRTGKKLGFKYWLNPRTKRKNKFRNYLTYEDYRYARTKAIKKKAKGQRLTKIEQKYFEDIDKLVKKSKKANALKKTNSKFDLSRESRTPRSILEAEDKIRLDRKETAIIFDQEGNKLFQTQGEPERVSIPGRSRKYLKDNILTHNHPILKKDIIGDLRYRKGVSFSAADIANAAEDNLKEIRVVSTGYRHSLTRPKGGWADPNYIKYMYQKIYDKHKFLMFDLEEKLYFKGGESLSDKAHSYHRGTINHRTVKELANDMGAKYVRQAWQKAKYVKYLKK